ncbi:HlyD family secretion protein [Neptunicella marina]|uniref:HlyD family secretion protein n=1 Tax=Neptunicella marina TaxID=2125989 RepID=A0A8J6IUA1_9ALTE|nr:HlyD family secretion protein [Neptunicella marina]MBC3766037.1 HlyD family secretion protein [Neptunicella marina]
MKLPVKKIVLATVAVALIGLAAKKGMHWYQDGRFFEETDNAYVKADTIAIRPELSGRLSQIAVVENQRVTKGQLLAEIAPADYIAKVAEAKAQITVGEAALADAAAQLALQNKKLEEADANIDATEAELRRSKLELQRFKVLEKQSFDSKQQLQNAEAAVDVAKARVAQAKATSAAAREMINVLKVQQQKAKAQLEVMQTQLAFAQNQLDKTRIIAPVDGVVGSVTARVGSAAQPNLTMLQLVPLPDVYIVANYKETQFAHMTIGQPVKIEVDAAPDIAFTGVIESLSPASGTEFSLLPVDNATGNFNKIVQRVPVRIRVTGPKKALPLLRPGLSVVPSVDTRDFNQQVSYLNGAQSMTDVASN